MANVNVVPDPSSAGAVLGGGAPPMAAAPPNTAGLQPGAPAPPPAGASMGGIAPQPQPAVHERGFAATVFGALADIFGGKTENQYSVNPDTGRTENHPLQLSRTQQGMRILGNALGGFAAGAQEHGPGAGMKAIGTGFSSTVDRNIQMDELARAHQKEDFEQQQKQIMRRPP